MGVCRIGNTPWIARGIFSLHSPALEEDMVAGFATVAGPGWGVMVPEPMSELMGRAGVARNASSMI